MAGSVVGVGWGLFAFGFFGGEVEDAVVLAGLVEHLLSLVEGFIVLDGEFHLAALVVEAVHDLLAEEVGDVATV